MNGKNVKRLFDMEIDEVSIVDRPANQHASILISKADKEGSDMPDGYGDDYVDIDDLDVGDIVVDDEGNEWEVAYEEEPELAGVGKAHEPALGEILLEELSKASSEDERSVIIAKAMNEVEVAKAEAKAANEAMLIERDLRITDEFISKAAEYNLPVESEVLGPILKSMAETLTPDQLDVVDAIFTSVGDTLYDEVGVVGGNSNGSVLDMVNSYADELVTKADIGGAQAVSDIFEANPEAYDQYLQEGNL